MLVHLMPKAHSKRNRKAMPAMVRTSLFLPRPLRARIVRAAKGLGINHSEIVRRALEEFVERRELKKHRGLFPIENMEQLIDSEILGDLSLLELQRRVRSFRRSQSRQVRRHLK